MHGSDIINAVFEASGGIFVGLNALDIWRKKAVAGQTLTAIGFFFAWGLWNLYFYPVNHMLWSSIGAVGVMLANVTMIALILRYRETPVG